MLCANVTGDYPQIGYGYVGTKLALYEGEKDDVSLRQFALDQLEAVANLPPPLPPRPRRKTEAELRSEKAQLSNDALKTLLSTHLGDL